MNGPPAIELDHLTKRFGTFTAVDQLTFRVERGEIFGFLGPNGAGKTTTVRMLACLISATEGTATVGGHRISDAASAAAIRRMIGIVPDNVGLYEALSATENLEFYARLYGVPPRQSAEAIERLLRLLEIWEHRDQRVGEYSKGMKQKVALARALLHDPEVLILDEPTANLDPAAAKSVRDFIVGLKRAGKTVFLNTHNLDEAQRICDRIGILSTRLLALGTPRDLEEQAWGRRTVFELTEVTDRIVAAVAKVTARPVERGERSITVEVTDPTRENPEIVAAIVAAGGRVESVSKVNAGLEDVYLKVVRGES